MKLLQSVPIICLAAALAVPRASAINLPVSQDTFGTTTEVKGTTKTSITAAGGKAASLPVSKSKTAFFRFESGDFGINPASVIEARVVIYLPNVVKPGDLALHLVTEDWAERFTGQPKPQPAIQSVPIAIIPAASVVAKQFIVVDVTAAAKGWLASPASEFGFALTSTDGVASVFLAAKEGSGSGYPATLEIETNAAAGVFQNGDVNSGLINGGFIAPGTIGINQIASNLGLWNRNGANLFSSGNVGIGTSTPGAPLEITTGPATFQIRNEGNLVPGINITGGANAGILRLRNSLQIYPNDAGTAAGSLDLRNTASNPTIRLDGGSARIGIGTANPAASLDINTGVGSVQIRNDSNLVPAINVTGGGIPGTLRMRNSIEIWPNDAGTAAGHLDVRDTTGAATISLNGDTGDLSVNDGRIQFSGSTTADFGSSSRQMVNLFSNTYGIGTQTNTLYHRSGGGFAWYRGGSHTVAEGNPGTGGTTLMKVDSNGNLSANNLPGVEFSTSAISQTCPAGANTTVCQVTVTVPAAGYIILTASVDLGTTAVDYFFRLRDTTSGATVLTSTLPKGSQNNVTLTYVVPVAGPGTKIFDAIVNPTGSSATVGDRNFNAIYVPVRY